MTRQAASSASTVLRTDTGEGDYLQFGCGLCAPQGWRNFDAGPAFWLQQKLPFLRPALVKRGYPNYPRNIEYGDIIKGLPVMPGSAKAVYCSHVLEHMALEELRAAIRNVYRYLQPGGIFRLVLPDLEYLARNYIADERADAASRFMEASHLGVKTQSRGLAGLPQMLFGRSRHWWMWDYKSLSEELHAAGFLRIRRAALGDSADLHFGDVEDPGRWENCLGIECSKP
jgi:predicted SAM-dependent methyltransferase